MLQTSTAGGQSLRASVSYSRSSPELLVPHNCVCDLSEALHNECRDRSGQLPSSTEVRNLQVCLAVSSKTQNLQYTLSAPSSAHSRGVAMKDQVCAVQLKAPRLCVTGPHVPLNSSRRCQGKALQLPVLSSCPWAQNRASEARFSTWTRNDNGPDLLEKGAPLHTM